MSAPNHSLRRRIVAAFTVFALATALCFSAFSLIFVYTVEDSFFHNMLRQEVDHQRQAGASPIKPLRDFVSIHRDSSTFPPDLARQFNAGAGREFFGDAGRHYHVVPPGAVPYYLVAEVSRELVVRARLPFIAGVLGALALAMAALTAGFGYWLARRATAPLDRLAHLVAHAAPGQLPRSFAGDFPDNEIGALAKGLEQAMDRIAEFIEREQHFTRDASHELRTPLAVVSGAAGLLASQPLAPQQAAQVQRIVVASEAMAQSVDTLLALAREDLGQTPSAEPVLMLPLVESVVVQHAHLLDGKAVKVVVDVDAKDCAVCRRVALSILLSNLVSNAFAHTMAGQVRISFEQPCLMVADSGPGIQPRLHRAGAKGEGSTGFGLGLSIAHRLAARSGIGLEIDSEAGAGTRAVLRFT
ncbi:HAMP domain-containing histidine kinase [Massilia sp. RP-1-19]|uniref:histidine kinase n=1 Tax=Massilia polaris TaxID=2728846 RepID=A0A848HG09_9BURK|nr:HAMP domain-containing sensor histidine kinase [Massilia polaris]NML60395.1 HAMP domain-containing histidine kinase [Massilia polaris]